MVGYNEFTFIFTKRNEGTGPGEIMSAFALTCRNRVET